MDAEVGPSRTSEVQMARDLVVGLKPGMLVLNDRGFYGFHLWKQAAGTGATRAAELLMARLLTGSAPAPRHEVLNTSVLVRQSSRRHG